MTTTASEASTTTITTTGTPDVKTLKVDVEEAVNSFIIAVVGLVVIVLAAVGRLLLKRLQRRMEHDMMR